MAFLAPFIPLIAGGLSAVGGALASRGKTSTQTNVTQYTPQETAMQDALAPVIQQRLTNPSLNIAPIRANATANINKTYDSLTKNMETSLVSRGFGSGGKLATGMKDLQYSRAGDMSDLEARIAAMENENQEQAVRDATQYAYGSPSGSTSTSTGSGNMLSGGLSSASETMTTLLMLSKLMGGGGLFAGAGGKQ